MNHHPKSLEALIASLVPAGHVDSTFRVVAYELTHDGESWSVNIPFTILNSGSHAEMLEAVRGRWEAFKANYIPRARVSDITDIGDTDNEYELEVNCTAFVRIELV